MNTRFLRLWFACLIAVGTSVCAFADDINGEDPEVYCKRRLSPVSATQCAHCNAGDLIRPLLADVARVCDIGRGMVTVDGQRDAVLCIFRGSAREPRASTPAVPVEDENEEAKWQRYNELKKEFFAQQKRAGHPTLAGH